jgi:hypothetical protein
MCHQPPAVRSRKLTLRVPVTDSGVGLNASSPEASGLQTSAGDSPVCTAIAADWQSTTMSRASICPG